MLADGVLELDRGLEADLKGCGGLAGEGEEGGEETGGGPGLGKGRGEVRLSAAKFIRSCHSAGAGLVETRGRARPSVGEGGSRHRRSSSPSSAFLRPSAGSSCRETWLLQELGPVRRESPSVRPWFSRQLSLRQGAVFATAAAVALGSTVSACRPWGAGAAPLEAQRASGLSIGWGGGVGARRSKSWIQASVSSQRVEENFRKTTCAGRQIGTWSLSR